MDSPDSLEIQRLAAGDLPHMRVLLNVFGDAFEDKESYCGNQPGDSYLERLLERDGVIVLVALVNGEVVGGLAAYELRKFEQERSEIYVYDLAVLTPYRRQGIATTLLESLKDVARRLGAYVIFIQADQGDEPAIALYTKLGIREEVLHFDIKVDDV